MFRHLDLLVANAVLHIEKTAQSGSLFSVEEDLILFPRYGFK